jgi:hypothetical protein
MNLSSRKTGKWIKINSGTKSKSGGFWIDGQFLWMIWNVGGWYSCAYRYALSGVRRAL